MSRPLSLPLIFISGVVAMSVLAAAPEYKPVPAELGHARDGLGNVLAKLQAGGEVRIAYFGGSITAAGGWRVNTFKWLQDSYPQAKLVEINAAIGGTGSDLGVFRCQQDVLSKHPDLIFVEFAVNDGGAAPEAIWATMEGIIRQAWRQDPTIDICYVYTYRVGYEKDLEQGMCPRAAGADDMLAAYYGIPSINVALRTVQLEQEGKLIYVSPKNENGKPLPGPDGHMIFSDDGVHPLDAGHQMYTDVIAAAIKEIEPLSKPGPHELKAPFVEGNWEQAHLVPLTPEMVTSGWEKLEPTDPMQQRFAHFMPEIWQATQPGEKIHFKFKGSQVRLYDIIGPDGGQAVVTVDGKSSPPHPLFDSYCSYHRLAVLGLAGNLNPDEVHEVTVEVHPDQPDRSSVTNREKDKPGFNPDKYNGTVLRFGSIMVIGEVVK
jgi:lysophospholipase L1-like esterase